MSDLLTRDQFRESVFSRDNNLCVICGEKAQDAHHILERRLFPDEGYYIDNGASLCGSCHLEAESTEISCDEIREKAGIKNVVLPPHLYRDNIYTKWGDIILPNKQRVKGELFFDESVQKIIKPYLDLYCQYVKYPRTYHCPWSPGLTKDDKVHPNMDYFQDKEIVVTIKMDGENCLEKNSQLITSKGNKFISQLVENKIYTQVLGYDEVSGKDVFVDILGFKQGNLSNDWYEIELEDGTILKATGDHKIFLKDLNCYRKVKNLKIGDNLLKK